MDTPTTEIYTLSLHDALPISAASSSSAKNGLPSERAWIADRTSVGSASCASSSMSRSSSSVADRKSTRLNSSHLGISYAVFCLKKKKTEYKSHQETQ